MSRKRNNDATDSKRLIDTLLGGPDLGALRGALATTYDLTPEFFEVDFLPAVFGLGAWDDRRWTSRIALERALAATSAVTVLMDGRRFQGRPRTLRVEVLPAIGARGQVLHAKITLLVFDNAVRLVVSSANLTEPGYRSNREVALCLTATQKRPAEGALIAQALREAPSLLGAWWTEGADAVTTAALKHLTDWGIAPETDGELFVWGGGLKPLWQTFLNEWPANEAVRRLTIVSPFWSEERSAGPLGKLLDQLAARQCLADGAELTLITNAAVDSGRENRPQLPATTIHFDPAAWGVKAYAVAADPCVRPEEVGGKQDVLRERALHAKVLLLEGPKSTMAYIGSANFTLHGWGIFDDPRLANVEAGVIVRRRGKQRASLAAVIPRTAGDRVPLTGAGEKPIAIAPDDEDEPAWPTFLRGVWLEPEPADESRLRLSIEIIPSRVQGSFAITIPNQTPTEVFSSTEPIVEPFHHVPLDAEAVRTLLREQKVLVTWWRASDAVEVPVNVTPAAREHLPFAPGDARPSEGMLLAYYQGRIAWEEIFPEEEGKREAPSATGEGAEPSAVDTSRIQSYQVRAFVEALQGVQDDLRHAAVSESAIRMAVLGPVSPVALAREVVANVRASRRSSTAGGFQLMELLACLARARSFSVQDRLQDAWNTALDRAQATIVQLVDEIRSEDPNSLKHPSFLAYERLVREQSRPEGT